MLRRLTASRRCTVTQHGVCSVFTRIRTLQTDFTDFTDGMSGQLQLCRLSANENMLQCQSASPIFAGCTSKASADDRLARELWLCTKDCEQAGFVQELKDFQRDGHSLEDLWKVAKGDTKYQDFVKGSIPRKQESQPAPAASVPEDLVS